MPKKRKTTTAMFKILYAKKKLKIGPGRRKHHNFFTGIIHIMYGSIDSNGGIENHFKFFLFCDCTFTLAHVTFTKCRTVFNDAPKYAKNRLAIQLTRFLWDEIIVVVQFYFNNSFV